MIPKGLETKNIEITRQPSKTYKIMLDYDFIAGMCDGMAAIKQAVYKILNTERYSYLIYSRRYGAELTDLFGRPVKEAVLLLPGRIKAALVQDDRITDVDNFAFDTSKKHVVAAEFTVHTTLGDFQAKKEVDI